MEIMEILEIGATPYEEDCYQVGCDNYAEKARIQCVAFKAQLIRQFGEPPEGARLYVKSNPHDFGNYYEVAVKFDSMDETAVDWAFKVEGNLPAKWDAEALKVPGAVCSAETGDKPMTCCGGTTHHALWCTCDHYSK